MTQKQIQSLHQDPYGMFERIVGVRPSLVFPLGPTGDNRGRGGLYFDGDSYGTVEPDGSLTMHHVEANSQ